MSVPCSASTASSRSSDSSPARKRFRRSRSASRPASSGSSARPFARPACPCSAVPARRTGSWRVPLFSTRPPAAACSPCSGATRTSFALPARATRRSRSSRGSPTAHCGCPSLTACGRPRSSVSAIPRGLPISRAWRATTTSARSTPRCPAWAALPPCRTWGTGAWPTRSSPLSMRTASAEATCTRCSPSRTTAARSCATRFSSRSTSTRARPAPSTRPSRAFSPTHRTRSAWRCSRPSCPARCARASSRSTFRASAGA